MSFRRRLSTSSWTTNTQITGSGWPAPPGRRGRVQKSSYFLLLPGTMSSIAEILWSLLQTLAIILLERNSMRNVFFIIRYLSFPVIYLKHTQKYLCSEVSLILLHFHKLPGVREQSVGSSCQSQDTALGVLPRWGPWCGMYSPGSCYVTSVCGPPLEHSGKRFLGFLRR